MLNFDCSGEDVERQIGNEQPVQNLVQSHAPVCLQVHKRSFAAESEPGSDVRKHLAAVRSSILEGVHLIFSHIIPQNFSRPQSHPMWQLAEQVDATLKSLSHA